MEVWAFGGEARRHGKSSGMSTRKCPAWACAVLACGLYGFQAGLLIGQADTLLTLPRADVSAARLRLEPAGAHIARFDSTLLADMSTGHAADLLAAYTGTYIKSYGLGSLATTSVRGGSAAHTSVVWNGLPLQSPMLGQLDFSLLPLLMADEVALQYSGRSAAWGSGAVGGALLLENRPHYLRGIAAWTEAGLGSFARRHWAATVRYGNGRLAGATRLFWEHAENDFPFRPLPGLPEQTRQNAALRQTGLLQEAHWKIRPAQELSLRLWRQAVFRQIPPTLVQSRSEAIQADTVTRAMAHWKMTSRRTIWQVRTAYFAEQLHYRDSLIRLDSPSWFRVAIAEAEVAREISPNIRLQAIFTHNHATALAKAYATEARQNRSATFATLRWMRARWQAQTDLRIELADGRWTQPTPALGLEYHALPSLQLRAAAARSYRLPTLNDLYWQPGGNPNLQPESGWSAEGGLVWYISNERASLQWMSTAYTRRIRNWILWARKDGQFFFSPQNIAEVWSRGLELRLDATLRYARSKWRLNAGFDYVRSTNERAVTSPRIETGSQLFYVPRHKGFWRLSFQRGRLAMSIHQQLVGAVAGLNEPVPAFAVASARAQWTQAGKHTSGTVFLQLENALNASYQVIERQPMPGRHFMAGIRLEVRHIKPIEITSP